MQRYPLPAEHLGIEHVVLLDHVELGTALAIGPLANGPLAFEVTLEPHPLVGGWRVRSPFGIVGFLDSEEAAEFPALERLREARLQPVTWASVEIVEGELELAVHLGLAPWQVALNDLAPNSVLLAGGRGMWVDTTASNDIVDQQLDALGACQLFVTLERYDEDIVVLLEDRVLGAVAAPDAALTSAVAAAAELAPTVAARAYLAESMVAIDTPLEWTADGEGLVDPAVPALSEQTASGTQGGSAAPVTSVLPAVKSPAQLAAWELTVDGPAASIPTPRGHRTVAGFLDSAPLVDAAAAWTTAHPSRQTTERISAEEPTRTPTVEPAEEMSMDSQEQSSWTQLQESSTSSELLSHSEQVRRWRAQRDAQRRWQPFGRTGSHRK